ncbi:MAG TPA: electron transfer flavoprotein subunit alpha/FixB family protein [Candidatus Bathyarchaeota archaeon]|nr:electron transfer flavoprotein subunit alpha/FixB family protein [Candidatus Bathyarchaeota archaeon]
MREIFVLAEHRRGELRDVTFEMLTKGRELAQKTNSELTAVILGKNIKEYAKTLAEHAKRVLVVEDEKLEHFNSDAYQKVLSHLIRERKPLLTMIGHTSYGIDLAPSLAVELNLPLATDCIDLEFEDGSLIITRQMYGGKVNVRARMQKAESYIVTIRQAAFSAEKEQVGGEIVEVPSPLSEEIAEKKFIDYVLPPPGAVDITAADVIVAIGRGIKDQSNIPVAEELAKTLGGVLACSRPVVDKGWLSSDRQVGTSGKTVKPKLYIALGISGAFQHVLGMKNSDLIIAVNKDPNAPIFNVADYGIVDDLFKVVPVLTEKLKELKGGKA